MDLRDVSTFGVLIEKLNNYMTAAKSHGLEDEQAEELIKNNMEEQLRVALYEGAEPTVDPTRSTRSTRTRWMTPRSWRNQRRPTWAARSVQREPTPT